MDNPTKEQVQRIIFIDRIFKALLKDEIVEVTAPSLEKSSVLIDEFTAFVKQFLPDAILEVDVQEHDGGTVKMQFEVISSQRLDWMDS